MYALISVSNKTGLEALVRVLHTKGYKLLATSGSAKFLHEISIPCIKIEEYTGQKEILGGRVKTLHPKIYAGLLARRNNKQDLEQLAQDGIGLIDIAVINLYPFIENICDSSKSTQEMQELIDIGGPSMIRAAAKNFNHVTALIDPSDYAQAISLIECGEISAPAQLEFRRALAAKVFSTVANYNLEIAKYFSNVSYSESGDSKIAVQNNFMLGNTSGIILEKLQTLRYGENPHQQAAYYGSWQNKVPAWQQLQGKELSYNNILDFDATYRMIRDFPSDKSFCVIVKHLNPCGAAIASTPELAFSHAKCTDMRSYFGGIVGVNQEVSASLAREITKDFFEIVIAPSYSDEALEIFKAKKDLRLIKAMPQNHAYYEIRSLVHGVLVQEADRGVSNNFSEEAERAGKHSASVQELSDLLFAWKMCAHVKSNAIVLAREGALLGVGAGQMSRIDSVEVAISKAKAHGHDLNSASSNLVAASDAFFPFTDNLEVLAACGVKAVVAPSGAKRDADVISTADKLGLSLYFARQRHFRH